MKLDIEFKESNSNFQSNFGELKVVNGKSAYEIAVEEGFVGTEEEWLASLHGKDGYTPQKGIDYFDGIDGKDGQDGSPGKDGTSATHSWNGTVLTITSASGTSSADLKGDKGEQGIPGPAGSVDNLTAESIESALGYTPADIEDVSAKIDKPSTAPEVGKILKVTAVNEDGSFVCEWADAPSGGAVDDVKINGKSVVSDGVANVPVLTNLNDTLGLLKVDSNSNKALYRGLAMQMDLAYGGTWLQIYPASNSFISNRNEYSKAPIVPKNLDYAVKAAMCDGKGAAWTDVERLAALLRMGCTVDDNGYVKWTAQE